MRLGQNLGDILLEIAQTSIQNGNPQKAITTYTDSLQGFTDEYALGLLKNEYVLITSDDGTSVNLTDCQEKRNNNKENIFDWDEWVNNKISDLMDSVHALISIDNEFSTHVRADILNYSLYQPIIDYFGSEDAKNISVHNIAAKLIAGDGFSRQRSNGENVWSSLCAKVENKNAKKYEYALYFIVNYVNNIRILHKEYMCLVNSCTFLFQNQLAKRPYLFEAKVEAALDLLCKFADTTMGYYHPMCNTKLYESKEALDDDILSTSFGKEFRRYGILEKNIMDGYDAGWLSPAGKFYGDNGFTSSMIHLRLAEQITKEDTSGDRKLEEEGWIKIHWDEVYGTFIGDLTPTDDYPYKYCPTDIQIKMICEYIDKFHNSKLYTKPKIVKETEPISTYKLRQMDKFKLHEIFGL